MGDLVSIVIPSRNEIFLSKTILDLLENSTGNIEIIAVLEGYWPAEQKREFWSTPAIIDDRRVTYLHFSEPRGMRGAINAGVALAKGEFILKCDAHCMFGRGYDEILKGDCGKDWVVVPRRYRMEPEKWEIVKDDRPPIDYMYLTCPGFHDIASDAGLHGREWHEKNNDPKLKEVLIDDLMSSQGSAWLMCKDYFHYLELLDEESYGTFWNEFQEIGLKVWLSGGRIVVNKKIWYAHLHKGSKYGRGYHLAPEEQEKAANHVRKWMAGKVWYKQTKPLSWLIEHFAPVPMWDEAKIRELKEKGN